MSSGPAWTVPQDSAWGTVGRKAGAVIKLQLHGFKYLYDTYLISKHILVKIFP